MPSSKRARSSKERDNTRSRRESSPKLQRWIDLIATLLAHHFPLPFEQLRKGVPAYLPRANVQDASIKRTFERDKDELRALGVPIETHGEEGDEQAAYRLATKDFYLPYLSVVTARGTTRPRRVDRYGYRALTTLAFEPDELQVLAEAAARVRELGDPLLSAEIDSAMRKLAFDLPLASVVPDDTHIVPARARSDPDVLETLGEALLGRKRVTFAYRGMESDATTRRTAEPYGLFFLNAHWYLAARDVEKGEMRNFRVSRIASPEVNTSRKGTADYTIAASFDLREHARAKQPWELGDGDALEAVVEFHGASGATYAAAALGEPVKGHAHRRLFRVRRPDAFARWLLSFGGHALPLSPPLVVMELRRQAELTRGLYASEGAR